MRWIRSNVRLGAWCALFALALQLALSFGHVHVEGGTAAAAQSALAASVPDSDAANPPSNPEPNRQASDFCAICALIHLAGTVTPATASVFETPVVSASAPFALRADRAPASATPLSFRARAPPLV
jgi:hypothetical protein